MKTDKFGNPIFQESDLKEIIYKGKYNLIPSLFLDSTTEIAKFAGIAKISSLKVDEYETIEFFDEANQSEWFIPEEYKTFPIVDWLYEQCQTQEEKDRVEEELTAFINYGMYDLLFCLKYIVDTLRSKNIVWGVGRGSSVASYVLYLIGIHKINSLKYNLDWREFLR